MIKREAEQLLSMIDKRVDGIMLCSGVSNREFLSEFRKYHVPMGLVGRVFDSSLSDVSITGDNIKGAMKSAEYLIQSGKRRIVYAEGNPDISDPGREWKDIGKHMRRRVSLFTRN